MDDSARFSIERIELAYAQTGFRVLQGMWDMKLASFTCACPLTALYCADKGMNKLPEDGSGSVDIAVIAAEFGVTDSYVCGFLDGFDDLVVGRPMVDSMEEYGDGYLDGGDALKYMGGKYTIYKNY